MKSFSLRIALLSFGFELIVYFQGCTIKRFLAELRMKGLGLKVRGGFNVGADGFDSVVSI